MNGWGNYDEQKLPQIYLHQPSYPNLWAKKATGETEVGKILVQNVLRNNALHKCMAWKTLWSEGGKARDKAVWQ